MANTTAIPLYMLSPKNTMLVITTLLILFHISRPTPSFAHKNKITIYPRTHPEIVQELGAVENQDSPSKGSLFGIKYEYFIKLAFGVKPTSKVTLIFDTGSSLTWLQDSSCTVCWPAKKEYAKSTTYSVVPCNASILGSSCDLDAIKGAFCSRDSCVYDIRYGDGSNSSGFISQEVFGFDLNAEPTLKLVFGLGNKNWCGASCAGSSGIAGFGSALWSIPGQLEITKWAFCLPIDRSKTGSVMFEDSTAIQSHVNSVSLIDPEGSEYYVANLTGVVIQGKDVADPDHTLVVLDSGSVATYLEGATYTQFMKVIEFYILLKYGKMPLERQPYHALQYCYDKPYQVNVSFKIGDIVIDAADPQFCWVKTQDTNVIYCLPVIENPKGGINIIGNHHLRGYYVGYDILVPESPMLVMSSVVNKCND